MIDHPIAIALLLLLSAFGFKSLHIFASSNGLLAHLEKCITNNVTPGGKPLRTLTTNGRFPAIDLQLRAVAVFLLIFCENLTQADADVVGFSFAANWGASWILIVLESLRGYSRARFMDWLTIPGLLIFNQSNAVFTPLYLAVRLAFASPSNTPESLLVATADLEAIPVSFLLGYVLPLLAMGMPGISIGSVNTKHVIASWYQQWNFYISLIHMSLTRWFSVRKRTQEPIVVGIELFDELQPVYMFCMAFAIVSLWVPVIAVLATRITRPRGTTKLTLRSLFLPPMPWSKAKCRDVFEGGKWLLQWDGMIGSLGSAVWATALFFHARETWAPHLNIMSVVETTLWYLMLGGPMAVATGLLWERDALVLSQ